MKRTSTPTTKARRFINVQHLMTIIDSMKIDSEMFTVLPVFSVYPDHSICNNFSY